MQITFLTKTGTVLFVRDDIEQGNFVHEEYSLSATFPYNPKKVIQDGQRLYFKSISGAIKCFEIIKVTTFPVDGYQQIVAEHIVISELTDEHINKTEITDKTPAQALTTVLTGTLWSVGNSAVSDVNSVDISRGDVWQAVKQIEQNWNCHIIPRLTFSSAGAITGRYLDIVSPEGVFRGARLSVDINMTDPSITYDDSEVKTALYGYGGNVDKPQQSGDDTTEELTFKGVVWTATSDHPAKPANQTYIEDPAKTAIYGRNGRPRFGYYQNANIKDANVLLQKTWESLKASSDPKVTVNGTVSELYRLGYKGQPLNLYDLVIVELRPINVTLQLQIVKFDEDLVDPTASRPEIGAYIPNIVYINRETDKKASGGGGGGRRGGMTNLEDDEVKAYTTFYNDGRKIGLVVGTENGIDFIRGDQIILSINEDGGTTATIRADCIDIDGLITALEAKTLGVGGLHVEGHAEFLQSASFEAGLSTDSGSPVNCGGVVNADSGFTVGGISGDKATWQTETIPTLSFSNRYNFVYRSNGTDYTALGYIVGSHGSKTIHYLGSATT
jgi:phage minor structural protein